MASWVYTEQVGWYRQCCPKIGETTDLYPRIKNNTPFFMGLAMLMDIFERRPVVICEILPFCLVNFLPRDEDHVIGFLKQCLVSPEKCAQPPLRPVPLDCISKFFAGNDSHSGKRELVGEVNKDEIFSSVSFALFI